MEIQIQGSSKDLEDLREYLYHESNDIELQEISSTAPGELREPILISLVVALGGPALVTGFVTIVKRWLQSKETLTKIKADHEVKILQIRVGHDENMKQLRNELSKINKVELLP